ncbi:MAG TPA: universal stress protein [Blastocatellia bacterium]|nr:universal stress protein [Blastocatellia bacterium]
MKKVELILAPTDFSENAHKAAVYAVGLALQLGAKVNILTVNSKSYIRQAIKEGLLDVDATDEILQKRTLELTQKRLAEFVRHCSCEGVEIETSIRTGDAGVEINHHATEISADLIVLGNYGIGGVRNILFGSAAEKVIRKSPCPVVLIHPHASGADS